MDVRIVVVVLAVLVVAAVGVALISPFGTATVWFSSNGTGYLCFLDYANSVRGGPTCLDDINNNATIPLGNYTIVFFATRIPQGGTFNGFRADGGLTVGNWKQYADPFSFIAPLTVNGDGTITVSWSQSTPILEFPATQAAMVTVIALTAFMVTRLKRVA